MTPVDEARVVKLKQLDEIMLEAELRRAEAERVNETCTTIAAGNR